MDREDLRKTQEMPIVERNGGAAWLYLRDPLGVFSHRRDGVKGRYYNLEGVEDEEDTEEQERQTLP